MQKKKVISALPLYGDRANQSHQPNRVYHVSLFCPLKRIKTIFKKSFSMSYAVWLNCKYLTVWLECYDTKFMEIFIDLNPFTGPFVMISSWNIFSITTDRDIWMTTSFLTTRRLTSFFLFSIFCLFFTSWRDCGFPFSLSLENFTITTLKYQPINLSHESQLKLNKNKIELWLCLISATRRWNSSSSFLTLNTMFHARKFRLTLSTLVKFLKLILRSQY